MDIKTRTIDLIWKICSCLWGESHVTNWHIEIKCYHDSNNQFTPSSYSYYRNADFVFSKIKKFKDGSCSSGSLPTRLGWNKDLTVCQLLISSACFNEHLEDKRVQLNFTEDTVARRHRNPILKEISARVFNTSLDVHRNLACTNTNSFDLLFEFLTFIWFVICYLIVHRSRAQKDSHAIPPKLGTLIISL
jgi:hypothetical protein